MSFWNVPELFSSPTYLTGRMQLGKEKPTQRPIGGFTGECGVGAAIMRGAEGPKESRISTVPLPSILRRMPP